MKERIHKVLANAGVASRRSVEEMVRQGRVAVNGKVRTDLPILIDPEKDHVTVDDEPIRLGTGKRKGRGGGGGGRHEGGTAAGAGRGAATAAGRVYLLMNKPKGVYSTNVAQGEQVRAIDLLPPGFPTRVYPVGQLDADSKGLLLLTNDGELTNRLTHPRYGVAKTYRAVVDGHVAGETVQELEQGVWLAAPNRAKAGGAGPAGSKTGRSRIKVVKRTREKSILEITMREGRNRQVRRMLAKLGHKVRDLTRVRMGPLTLEGLGPGQVRSLTPREVRDLRRLGERKPAGAGGAPEAAGNTVPAAADQEHDEGDDE